MNTTQAVAREKLTFEFKIKKSGDEHGDWMEAVVPLTTTLGRIGIENSEGEYTVFVEVDGDSMTPAAARTFVTEVSQAAALADRLNGTSVLDASDVATSKAV